MGAIKKRSLTEKVEIVRKRGIVIAIKIGRVIGIGARDAVVIKTKVGTSEIVSMIGYARKKTMTGINVAGGIKIEQTMGKKIENVKVEIETEEEVMKVDVTVVIGTKIKVDVIVKVAKIGADLKRKMKRTGALTRRKDPIPIRNGGQLKKEGKRQVPPKVAIAMVEMESCPQIQKSDRLRREERNQAGPEVATAMTETFMTQIVGQLKKRERDQADLEVAIVMIKTDSRLLM